MSWNAFFLITITVLLSAIIAAFMRYRSKDKCLNEFEKNMVSVEFKSWKIIWWKLNVESTGLELVYQEKHIDTQWHDEASYLIYKSEYQNIQSIIRFHDKLSEENKRNRELELSKTYHPSFLRRLKRKVGNFFNTIRDALMEALNMMISQTQKNVKMWWIIKSQDKQIEKMKKELVDSVATSFDPLLEKYIWKKVVLEITRSEKTEEWVGILKDYSSEFIELLDVNYYIWDQKWNKWDIIFSRKEGIIRHLAE